MTITSQRVPIDPLLDKIDPDRVFSHRDLGDLLGCSKSSIRRWFDVGIPVWNADTVAVYAGWMPWEIWPEFDHLTLPADIVEQEVLALIGGDDD